MAFPDLNLPSRPLAIARGSVSPPYGNIFGLLVFLVIAGFLVWWQGPGLVRDVQINQNPQVLSKGQVLDGECTTRRGITDCDARLVYNYNGVDYDTTVSIVFVDLSSGDYLADVVISKDKPELATLTLALDMLWNRLIVFALLLLFTGGGASVIIVHGIRVWNVNRAVTTPGRLTVLPVSIAANDKKRGGLLVNFIDHPKGPKSNRTNYTRFKSGEEPLLATDADGLMYGLAVQHERAALPILLDSKLMRLDMTDAERKVALAGLGETQVPWSEFQVATKAPAQKKRNPLRVLMGLLIAIVLIAALVMGYWLWYVTSAGNAFDAVGIELNNMMPGPVNAWGCEQLQARFGDERAPFGCTADDYTSWR
ncbi:hypothetical protein [Devosia sp. 2618]|uniref:hypothetical protein n=1 Tax=Devosia sp. 2618 TaxID=3156454 RepID=UPI0033981DDB